MTRRNGSFGILLLLALLAGSPLSLARPDDAKKVGKRLQAALQKGDDAVVAECIRELGEIGDVQAVRLLLQVALQSVDPSVVGHCRETLGALRDEAAVLELTKILLTPQKKPDAYFMRVVVTDALALVRGFDERVAESLGKAALEDPEMSVRRAAVEALGKRRSMESIDALIPVLAQTEKVHDRLWYLARQQLTGLTGQDLDTAQEWREWWQPLRESFDFDKDRGEKTRAETTVRNRPKYFDREVDTNHAAFVLDISGSMVMWDASAEFPESYEEKNGTPEVRVRMERARKELLRVIDSLEPPVMFTVLAFSDSVRQVEKGIFLADKKGKDKARKFVEGLRPTGGTYTDVALVKAFELQDVDTIYLLSDGAPMKTGIDEQDDKLADQILTDTRARNAHRRIRIFTFGFDGPGIWPKKLGPRPTSLKEDKSGRFASFMRKLAQENLGEYKSLE